MDNNNLTIEISGLVAGVKLDVVKREATVSIKARMNEKFMLILDRLGQMGYLESPVVVTITSSQGPLEW